ncbi:MAG: efflux RND transporter periplasmic adaptor subunit [Candidatus Azambacteria bacterium]|nr:efflux RND transporter periplasmic adaptor subunit [Candidatus Azambacteria bacterium]
MSFFKKPVFIIIAVVLVILLGGYFYFFSGKKTGPEFVVAKKGNIVQEISVTGNVKPMRSVDLAFEKSGKISAVYADVGNYVSLGQILVRQDTSELSAQLSKAEADLDSQKADLDKAKTDLANYYSSITNILNSAYTKADDAVRNQTSALFIDGESDTPKLNFTTVNSQAQTDAQNSRVASKYELNVWRQEINQLSAGASNDDLYAALGKAENHLNITRNFLVAVNDALNKTYGVSQTTLDSYKTAINTAREEVDTASDNVLNKKNSIDSQKAVVTSNIASIQSFGASVKNIEAQITKTALYAPINGIVTKQDAKMGEIAAANIVLISVLSSTYKIEANIPEVDIAKIKIGDSAKVTLDAYGKDVAFEAKVTAIDPAETMIEGVATYKTTLQFISNDKPVKSGMTANLDIYTAEKSNVLIVPQRAVFSKDSDKFVNLYNPSAKNGIIEIKVVTGLRGSDGNIEITSGLKEGDKVIISQEQ